MIRPEEGVTLRARPRPYAEGMEGTAGAGEEVLYFEREEPGRRIEAMPAEEAARGVGRPPRDLREAAVGVDIAPPPKDGRAEAMRAGGLGVV